MRLPSGSRWQRVFACLAAGYLPGFDEVGDVYSSRGTELHEFLATARTVGRDVVLARLSPTARETAEAIDLDELPQTDPARFAHELAIAYNVQTGEVRELHRGGGKSREEIYASLKPTEIGITLDVAGLGLAAGTGAVVDWKTGYRDVEATQQNWQIRIQALVFARLFGLDYIRAAVGKIREDGRTWFDYADFDALDLDTIEGELRRRAREVLGADAHWRETGEVRGIVTGAHCRGCPAFASCPAKLERARDMAKDAGEVAFRAKQLLQDPARRVLVVGALEEMKQVRAKLEQQMGQAIAGVEGAVRMWIAEHGAIELGDGRVYGPEVSTRSSLDGEVTYKVVRERFDEQTALAATTREATKSGLEKALKSHAPKGKGATLVREVTAAIERAGGLKVSTKTEWHIHTPPAKALPAPTETTKPDESAGVIE